MKSIEHLHLELHAAKERDLIVSFETIDKRDIILVELNKNTTLTVCHRLQNYINQTYEVETYFRFREKMLYVNV